MDQTDAQQRTKWVERWKDSFCGEGVRRRSWTHGFGLVQLELAAIRGPGSPAVKVRISRHVDNQTAGMWTARSAPERQRRKASC
jgi:hypothetical protein